MDSSIFIMIPAYEDATIISTIIDALSRADSPEKLGFAIAMQYSEVPYPDISQWSDDPRFIFIDYEVKTRPGVMQIRNRLASLHQGQEYVLLCDSHTTFTDHWDSKLISDYKLLQSQAGNRVIISAQMGEDRRVLGDDQECGCTTESGPRTHLATEWKKPSEVTNFDFLWAEPAPVTMQHQDFLPTYYSSHHMFFFQKDYISDGWMFDSARNYGEETFSSYIAFMKGWTIYRSYRHIYMYHNQNANGNYSEIAKTKTFSALQDRGSTIYEIVRAMLYNTGRYSIKSEREPREFYQAIGLEEQYDKVVSLGLFSSSEAPDFGEPKISVIAGSSLKLAKALEELGHDVVVIDKPSDYYATRHLYHGADYVFVLAAEDLDTVSRCAKEARIDNVISI